MNFRRVAIVALSLVLWACAPATRVQSNKAQDYANEPKRVFVLTDVGSDFGDEYAQAFQERLTGIAKDCGAVLEVSRVSSLELDNSARTTRMNEFKPDVVLSIFRAGGTRNQYGLFHVIYDARLQDVESKKLVWRANFSFHRGGGLIPIADRGRALAVDITNRMKQDGIVRSCPVIKPAAS